MTNTNVDRLVEEIAELIVKDFNEFVTNTGEIPGELDFDEFVAERLKPALSQARQEGRGEEREKITGIVEEWMKTSNPSYAQDLFDALTTEGK